MMMTDTDKNPSSFAEPQEIAKFSETSWWQDAALTRMLHEMNPVRLEFIRMILESHWSEVETWGEKKLLDVGCGGGILTLPLKRMGFAVRGIDLSETAIAEAHKAARDNGLTIDFQARPLEAMPDAGFDAICALELVEHLDDWQGFIREAVKKLAPSGFLFLSTLRRNWQSRLLAITVAESLLGLLPKGTHDWRKFINPSELIAALHDEGLHLIAQRQMPYSPLSGRFSLTRGAQAPNYILAARRLA